MILYRTDDFSKSRSTNIVDVLMYELFERENEQLLGNLLSISFSDTYKEEMYGRYQELVEIMDKAAQEKLVEDIITYWKNYFKKDFKHAIWLYPLDNVKEYVEFYACDGMLPLIYGYETSNVKAIEYENEGGLYFYEELPEVKERV